MYVCVYMYKLQGTLDPMIQTTYEGIKQRWAQYWSLGTPVQWGCQFEKELFTSTLWVQPVWQFPTCHTDHFLDLTMSVSLGEGCGEPQPTWTEQVPLS